MVDEAPANFLDRMPNPYFGEFQASNVVEGTINRVHTDEAQNVTLTADVVTFKNELKSRVPFLLPYANYSGTAGIYAVPSVGDKCLVALAAGNQPYIVGYHPAPSVELGRATAATGGANQSLKGSFARTQLIPGSIMLRTIGENQLMMHPGGSIAIDSRQDLYTFYDAVLSTITHLCRQYRVFSAGGSMLWTEGQEKSKTSMTYAADLFTKSATKENLEAGPLRGGAHLKVLFSEQANHFYIKVEDDQNITGQIQIGPNGVIISASDGTNQGSIAISPSGNFSFIAGDPAGMHSQLDLAPTSAAMTSFTGSMPLATVVTDGSSNKVTVSSLGQVVIDAPQVVTQGGITSLGALGGLPNAKMLDAVTVFGVSSGNSSANGLIMTGSATVQSAM
jgi:hypothetical protein